MLHIYLLNSRNAAHTCDLCVDLFEAGRLEHAQPGILFLTCHVVVGVITCHDHERPEHNLGVSCRLHFFDDRFAGGIFRLSLDGSDESVCISQLLHLCLHLVICHLCRVRCSVSQEDKRRSVFLSCVETVVSCLRDRCLCDCLCYGFLVGVDLCSVRSDRSQKGLRYFQTCR